MNYSDADTFKIYITSDTHLGYNENDTIRKNDSFITFEEILMMAKNFNVDFLIHGGDLFDVQIPTQYNLHQCINSLSKYCMGPNKMNFEVIATKPSIDNFEKPIRLNFLADSNINICLPIFMIHGNHDPPIATIGSNKSISAIDVLSSASLVNDIGKVKLDDKIILYPTTLRKGKTKILLYGIGYIRDQRMHQLFKEGSIQFAAPYNDDCEEYFSIFIIHQNRFKGAQARSGAPLNQCVRDIWLPEFIDLVIWGHEHDCVIDPTIIPDRKTYIIQPGSTICTSLRKGEAYIKKNCLLEICGNDFRTFSFPLLTTRPFMISSFYVDENHDPYEVLQRVINSSIHDSEQIIIQKKKNWFSDLEKIVKKSFVDLKINELTDIYKSIIDLKTNQEIPLVRIKADFKDQNLANSFTHNKLSLMYKAKIANIDDIVVIKKKLKKKYQVSIEDSKENLLKPNINEDTKNTIFNNINKNVCLKIVDLEQMLTSVTNYVDRNVANALDLVVDEAFDNINKKCAQLIDSDDSTLDPVALIKKAQFLDYHT